MPQKPTKAELEKGVEDRVFMKEYLESNDPQKREAVFEALFKSTSKPKFKSKLSPEEALELIWDAEDTTKECS